MADAEETGFGHLVETCTLLVRIQTCPSTKPHEKGVHFVTMFKVKNSQGKRGPRCGPGREVAGVVHGSLGLPPGAEDDSCGDPSSAHGGLGVGGSAGGQPWSP